MSESMTSFRCERLEKLGRGSFGDVFLCIDLDNNKKMAMKIVETGDLNQGSFKKVNALKQELQLYQKLKHKRIVQYFGVNQDQKSMAIFLEYMEGGSIHSRILQIGAFPEIKVSKYCRQILEGIEYLHSEGIIHRDIKGENILLDKSDNCKLADFGVSKEIKTIRSKASGTFAGTFNWMSPEVIKGEKYGKKADIWSFGCIAVEMLTTEPPWSSLEPQAALFKIATEPTIPDLPKDTSLPCQKFVDICLCRDQDNRPNALELLDNPFLADKILECTNQSVFSNMSTEEDKRCETEPFEYIWKLEHFTTKYESMKYEPIYSESFYTSMGYHVRLVFERWIDGINICLQVMKGQHDEHIKWPYLNPYKISLINRHDTNHNQSWICDPKKDYDDNEQQKILGKPRNEYNDYCGGLYGLIISKDNSFNKTFLKDDNILIKYEVSINPDINPFQ